MCRPPETELAPAPFPREFGGLVATDGIAGDTRGRRRNPVCPCDGTREHEANHSIKGSERHSRHLTAVSRLRPRVYPPPPLCCQKLFQSIMRATIEAFFEISNSDYSHASFDRHRCRAGHGAQTEGERSPASTAARFLEGLPFALERV